MLSRKLSVIRYFWGYIIVFVLVFSCEYIFARIPEPDTILIGTLVGNNGETIVSRESQKIIVRAVVDGATLATAEVPTTNGDKFILRVPMDDGVAPRIIGTAKSSDRIKLFVDNNETNLSIEPKENEFGGIEIPVGRGNVLMLSLSVPDNILSDDINNNSIPDSWEEFYSTSRNGYAGISLKSDDSGLDNDNDGFTNREEYIAGTDPQDETGVFKITSVKIPETHSKNLNDENMFSKESNASLRITFAPMVNGRLYTLRRSTDISKDKKHWDNIATIKADSDADCFTWVLPEPTGDIGFYYIAVEVAE